jgi:O-acetyl-ADP-ribose deacetylase (regulator of RNase III)
MEGWSMITNTIKGDLIVEMMKMKYDIIVHGCNCFCIMGKGIAKTIKFKFPEAYEEDCKTIIGDKNKLGTYTKADMSKRLNKPSTFIINAYTQYDYRKTSDGINVDYGAIRNVFKLLNENFSGKKFGIPKIGAGLAGGDWNKIAEIINSVTPNIDIELVEFVEFMA